MQLLKFKSELSPPAIPSTELAQLVKFSLHHPESYTHRFTQNRWDTLLHSGDTPQTDFIDLVSLPPPEKPATSEPHGCGCQGSSVRSADPGRGWVGRNLRLWVGWGCSVGVQLEGRREVERKVQRAPLPPWLRLIQYI